MTTHDTPEAALKDALKRHHDSGGFCGYCSSDRVFEPWPCDAARAREEIARLRAALEIIAAKPEPGNGTAIYRRAIVKRKRLR